MPTPPRTTLLLIAATGLALALPAAAQAQLAEPGFRVEACRGKEDPRGAAFADFATRNMTIKRACTPYGRGVRGMVVSVKHSGKKGARVKRGSIARLTVNAPPGTAIRSAAWSGRAVRSDCGYAMDVWADGAQRDWTLYDTNKCPPRGRAQSSGDRREAANGINAGRVVLRVICTARGCSRRGKNYLRTSSVALRLADVQNPVVSVTAAPQTWVNGLQPIRYAARDNAGIAGVYSTGTNAGHTFQCLLITTTPCPRAASDSLQLDTRELPEGTQPISTTARDVSGRSGVSAPVAVHVDRTPPGRVAASVAGGETWRAAPTFALGWTNPAEVDRAPVVAARYTLCRVGAPGTCRTQRSVGQNLQQVSIQPPAPGDWTLRTWREDAAGNQSSALASDPVHLRYDPTSPEIAFEPTAGNDPTRVVVTARDAVSGVASGAIELSREGSGVWQQVPTQLAGGRLVGRVDDSRLPAGRYQLRARAVDQAGNEKSAAGTTVQLPLRIATVLRAGHPRTKIVRKRVRRNGKRRIIRRKRTTYTDSARIRFGRSAMLRGRLTNRDENPITGPIAVYEQGASTPGRLVAIVSTTGSGAFAYRARGTTSRTVTFAYLGNGVTLPAARAVKVTVPGASTMRASKRKLLNGQALTFSGRVRTGPVPAAGKLIALQAYVIRGRRGRWTTFRTLRSDTAGRWRFRYRFTATCERRKRWRLRAVIPREAGLPYGTGTSRIVTVLVRGNGSC